MPERDIRRSSLVAVPVGITNAQLAFGEILKCAPITE